jgi:hypothetical protein
MDIDYIRSEVSNIRNISNDPEAAHGGPLNLQEPKKCQNY